MLAQLITKLERQCQQAALPFYILKTDRKLSPSSGKLEIALLQCERIETSISSNLVCELTSKPPQTYQRKG